MGQRRARRARAVRWGAVAAGLALVAAACGSGGGSGDPAAAQRRTVQVDYRSDELASSLFDYFPRTVAVRPGDTVEFKQAWTGEPHSVTMGTLVDEKIQPLLDLYAEIETTGILPEEEPPLFEPFAEALPFAFGEAEDGSMSQNAAQPCYVDGAGFDGTYPGDADTPCPRREQPVFDGSHAIYNSGIIPYEGVKNSNVFEVKLADDLEPGKYRFYCNVHGPLQWGQLDVKAKGAPIPGRSEVAREARKEAERKLAPLLRNFRAAQAGKVVAGGDAGEIQIDAGKSNIIGVPTPFLDDKVFLHSVVNEFVPKEVQARVGRKTTWTFVCCHTLSFNVPKYFPIIETGPDGSVNFNPRAFLPVDWPGRPESEGEEDGPGPPPPPVSVDAGTWDGQGFRSTGLGFSDNDTFSVTFTKAGTYAFACLVHPQMVGKLVVKA